MSDSTLTLGYRNSNTVWFSYFSIVLLIEQQSTYIFFLLYRLIKSFRWLRLHSISKWNLKNSFCEVKLRAIKKKRKIMRNIQNPFPIFYLFKRDIIFFIVCRINCFEFINDIQQICSNQLKVPETRKQSIVRALTGNVKAREIKHINPIFVREHSG